MENKYYTFRNHLRGDLQKAQKILLKASQDDKYTEEARTQWLKDIIKIQEAIVVLENFDGSEVTTEII